MYDMHYDLLTILYFNLKKNNPLANINKLIDDCKKIYKNGNIKGGIINLYFESIEEMKEELGIEEAELYDVVTMFKKSIEHLKDFQEEGIIPKDIDYIYSIEGCDFLDGVDDLDTLYKLGLRSMLPVWNNPNKFGSGNRDTYGLTEAGVELIKKAIDLGIIIDVSHANQNTFYDIADVVDYEKNKGKKANLIASHSNVRMLCDRERNLTDRQLRTLKHLDGYIGLFTNGNFLSLDNKTLSYEERIKNYLKHLDYIINVIGFSEDRILLATDNMDFTPQDSYHNLEACPYNEINERLHDAISKKYDNELTDLIMEENAKKLIHSIR